MQTQIHPADPNHPKGMAWVLAAGFPDPREGSFPNIQLVLKQGWEAWSQQAYEFGLRWHPELQTKWVVGGGQFGVGEITTEKPPAEPTLEESCEEVLDMIAESQPGFVNEMRRIRGEGTEQEKAQAVSELRKNMVDMMKIAQYMEGKQ